MGISGSTKSGTIRTEDTPLPNHASLHKAPVSRVGSRGDTITQSKIIKNTKGTKLREAGGMYEELRGDIPEERVPLID